MWLCPACRHRVAHCNTREMLRACKTVQLARAAQKPAVVGPPRSRREPIQTYRRYLRLIDPKPRVWFHALEEEVSMTSATVTERSSEQTTDTTAIRPFRADDVPEEELTELRRRINAT